MVVKLLTFKFHKVMQQHIRGKVADYIKASSGVHGRMQDERVVRIGPYLPKLSQKDCVGVLFLTDSVQFCV